MMFLKWCFVFASTWACYAALIYLIVLLDLNGPFTIAALLPITMFALGVSILNPAKRLVTVYMPDCKLKRLLLYRYS